MFDWELNYFLKKQNQCLSLCYKYRLLQIRYALRISYQYRITDNSDKGTEAESEEK